jgi:hypothetical protein
MLPSMPTLLQIAPRALLCRIPSAHTIFFVDVLAYRSQRQRCHHRLCQEFVLLLIPLAAVNPPLDAQLVVVRFDLDLPVDKA